MRLRIRDLFGLGNLAFLVCLLFGSVDSYSVAGHRKGDPVTPFNIHSDWNVVPVFCAAIGLSGVLCLIWFSSVGSTLEFQNVGVCPNVA